MDSQVDNLSNEKISKEKYVPPTDAELLKMAGGTLDMIHTGKDGMELRSILAARVGFIIIFINIIFLTFLFY